MGGLGIRLDGERGLVLGFKGRYRGRSFGWDLVRLKWMLLLLVCLLVAGRE